jgi:hypothetical protein
VRAAARTLAALLIVAAAPAVAADELAPDLQATLHLKVLSYDRALKKRSGGAVAIAVLHAPGDQASEKAARAVAAAFSTLAGKVTVQGMKATVVVIAADPAKLDEQLAGATVVYAASGLEKSLDAIVAAATRRKAPTLTSSRDAVVRGMAIGVVRAGDKPKIVINLKATKQLGMDVDPKLLRLAELVK